MKKIIPIFFIVPLFLKAQDITGVWSGYLKTPGSELPYELTISDDGFQLTGYSLIVYMHEGAENIGIKTAKIRRKGKEINFEDDELVYDNFKMEPVRTKLTGSVRLLVKDTIMIMRGSFSTRSIDFRDTRKYSGEIFLQKKDHNRQTRLITELKELNLYRTLSFTKKPTQTSNVKRSDSKPVTQKNINKDTATNKKTIAERKVEKIREIFFSGDSLEFSIVDNGTIDGDTLSLELNGKMIASRIPLKLSAYKIKIAVSVNPGDSLLLIMHAESLGSFPPNTGLLTIQDVNSRHQVRFEGDYNKSSAIILRKRN